MFNQSFQETETKKAVECVIGMKKQAFSFAPPFFSVGRCYLRSGSPRRLKEKTPINPNPIAYDTLREGMFVEKFSEQLGSLDFGTKQLNI